MKIPLAGNVCPFCHHDKSRDRIREVRWHQEREQERQRVLLFALGALLLFLAVLGIAYLAGV
jgi:hypothetical protein